MSAHDFETPEELVQAVQVCLNEGDFKGAMGHIEQVDEAFDDDAVAHHIAGLVHERHYIDLMAQGASPTLELYDQAISHYRRALSLEPDASIHLHRLYACLFVIGTQREDRNALQEAADLAVQMADSAEGEAREASHREIAIIATMQAKLDQGQEAWERANRLFDNCSEPPPGPESWFYHYYRGLARRQSVHFAMQEKGGSADQERVREAITSLHYVVEEDRSRPAEFLLADCLMMLDNPSEEEKQLLVETMDRFVSNATDGDVVVESLKKRYALRLKLMRGDSSSASDSGSPS